MQHGNDLTLSLRQLQVGSVAALESRFLNLKLFSLQIWRDTAYEYHGIRIAHLCQDLLAGRLRSLQDIKLHHSHIFPLGIIYLNLNRLACFQRERFDDRRHAAPALPHIHDGIAIHYQAATIVNTHIDGKILIPVRSQHSLIAG